MQNLIKYLILLFITTALSHPTIYAQNLLTNGDFESGGSGTGFLVHNYTVINPVNGTSTPGKYAITTNPKLMNSTYTASGDHTTGNGKMLVIDGSNSSNQFFWTTGNTGSPISGFTIGTNYIFSFWVKSVSNDVTNATQSTINVIIPVGATNINPLNTTVLAPLPSAGWQQVSFMFTATSNMVMVRLFTTSTSTIGNDFAVDDFSITAGSLPLSLDITSTLNPTCPNSLDGSIIVSAKFGNTPYNYTLTGPVSKTNNTGIFTGLNEGTYDITVKDAANKTDTKQVVLTVPGGITVSPDVSTCAGSPTPLTVSGGSGGYTWTASPADPTLTTPTSATINVSPTQTTTYTVTSGTPPDPTNFVNNGDFSFGDSDFSSDYLPVANPNPFGVKGAYGIVTNPQTWFNPFDPCPDHTSGNGLMMVVDGSDKNSGNDRLWVQSVAVLPNQDYDFRYYIQTLTAGAPARIEVYINGVSMGAPVNSPSSKCLWQPHTYTWNSGPNTTATITIYDRETSGGGNDFAIDDISLKKTSVCSFQKNVTITINNTLNLKITDPAPVCSPTTVDIKDVAVTAGSSAGTLSYWTDASATTLLTNANLISVSGTYYIQISSGSCSVIKPVLVTINNSSSIAVPAVNSPINYCQNGTASPLTAISAPGATLNWYGTNLTGGIATATAPTPSTTASGKYYVSQSIGTCESSRAEIEVIVSPLLTPTFDPIAAVCQNAAAPILPPNSTNSPIISGTWNPSSVSTATSGTTLYTFTPSSGTCYTPTKATISITVNPSVAPNFAPISAFCEGSGAPKLETTSPTGITGTWFPATIDNLSSGSYLFTPNATLFPCSPTQTLNVTVTPKVVTTVASIGSLCQDSLAPVLPTTSTNSPTINGTWNASIDTSIAGTKNYIFTPSVGVCATTATLPITIDSKIIPSFEQVPPICSGTTLSALPTKSKNNITGSWSPAIDNTKTTIYTFKPDTGQCADTTTMEITVNPSDAPNFAPISAFCEGSGAPKLETTSPTGITGTWFPATIDNLSSGSYLFTPNATLFPCSPTQTLNVTVTPKVVTTVVSIGSLCQDSLEPVLPTTSTNSPTINGTWNASIDTSVPGTKNYIFTPSVGVCATTATLPITIDSKIIPSFEQVPPICSGTTLSALPTKSKNNITGSWSPAIDNTKTTTYTFKPDTGQCAETTTMEITVNPKSTPTFKPVPDICLGAVLSPLPLNSTNGISGTWSPALNNIATTIYTFTPSSGQCATAGQLTIAINSGATIIPLFNSISPICAGQIVPKLPTTSLNAITGIWTPAINPNATTTYTFKPDSGQCAASITQQISINPLPTVITSNDSFSICSGSSTAINLSSDVAGTTFTWNVLQANVKDGSAGSGSSIDQLLSTAGNKPGEAIYAVYPIANGCPGTTKLVTVTVNPIPEVTANPSQQTICSGATSAINLSSTVGQTTYSWTVTPNIILGASASTGDTISQTLVNTTLLSDTAIYLVTPSVNGCSGMPLSIPITVNPTPQVFGSGPTTICSEEYTNIVLKSNILGSDFSWTALQTGVSGAKAGTGNVIEDVLETGINIGTAVYTITPSLNECKGNPIAITIKVNPLPSPSLSDGIVCLKTGTDALLNSYTIESGLSTSNYDFEWFLDKTKIIGAIGNTYEATEGGNYSLIVTDKLTRCVSKESPITVIKSYPAASFTTIVSDAFTENASVTVVVEGATSSLLYQIDGGEWQRSNIFANLSSGNHTINIVDEEGCTNLTGDVFIIDYPKFFTPNGDGSNDKWNIVGLNDDQSKTKIFIYDRYGKLLKQISTQGEGWDGTFNGYELPATDYWFTIDYLENNVTKLFKAHFSLKR